MNSTPTKTGVPVVSQWLWVAAFVAALTTSALAQSGDQLVVGVRSQLDRQKNTQNGKLWDGTHLREVPSAPEHSKVYGLLAFQRVSEVNGKLVRPVDEAALKAELIRQLDAHGFQHAGPQRRPDILLTVVYGRSWLPNPYYVKNIDVDMMGPKLPDNPFSAKDDEGNVAVDDPKIAARLMEPGAEEKASRSMLEKLFIMVRAWKNPTNPKEKPTILWVATMFVDDPNHEDLNVIAKRMLEAGAPFFDKEIPDVGVEIVKPLPEGHVKVGTPEVIEHPVTK